MVVAKRQRENPMKTEQKKICRLGVRTSDETNTPPFWLALIRIGQAQGGGDKTYKKWDSRWVEASSWGSAHPHASGYTILNKTLGCNQAVTLVRHFKFLLLRDRTEQITHFPNSVFSEITETLESLKASAYLLKPLIIWYHSIFPASLPNCSLYELGLQWIQTI